MKHRPDGPTADQQCCCNREKRCSCAIKRELLGPITEGPKRGIKRTRSNTETDKDKARPRGLSATQSDPNLNVFAKRHKTGYHRYSLSGQENSAYHGRPHSQHGSAAYSPVSVENIMARNGPFMVGRRSQGLQTFSPYSTESIDSLSSLPYDVHRPFVQGIPNYSTDTIEPFASMPRNNLPYDVPRPRSIHGHATYAQKLEGFQPMGREDTPQLYADGVAALHDERRVRSAHTSPGPAPAGKLERYANHYPHLEIPPFGTPHPNITSSPVGDDYGQRYGNLEYLSPTDGAGSMSGEPPSMPVADWSAPDLPLNPGAFTSAQSHTSSSYASFDPIILAQQPGLTDASSGDVSEADEYAQHQSVASPSVACTSPYVHSAIEARGGLLPYNVSASDPYGELAQSTMMSGQVEHLGVEPYLHRATASPVDHSGYATPPKAESEAYPQHGLSVADSQRLSPYASSLENAGEMAHGVTQPTSDPSWAEQGQNDGAGYPVTHTSAQPTSDPSWVTTHVDASDSGHAGAAAHASSQTHVDPNWATAMRQAHDGSPIDGHQGGSRHQSPYAAALQPTSDPSWVANAAVAAAHDPVGVPANVDVHSRHCSPHPSVAPTSNPAWASPHAFHHTSIANDGSPSVDLSTGISAVAAMQQQQQQQQRQGSPPTKMQGDVQMKLEQQQGQAAWSSAAAAAFAEQQQQQQARFHAGSGGASPASASATGYPYGA